MNADAFVLLGILRETSQILGRVDELDGMGSGHSWETECASLNCLRGLSLQFRTRLSRLCQESSYLADVVDARLATSFVRILAIADLEITLDTMGRRVIQADDDIP